MLVQAMPEAENFHVESAQFPHTINTYNKSIAIEKNIAIGFKMFYHLVRLIGTIWQYAVGP